MDKSFRKFFLIPFAFCAVSFFSFAGNDEELFLRGNNHYHEGEYDKALALYERINNKGRAVLYNMANCFYYKKEYAQALVYWGRAEQGASRHERNNIVCNREQLLKVAGKYVPETTIQTIYTYVCAPAYAVSFVFLQVLFLWLWYMLFFMLYQRKKKGIGAGVFVCLVYVGILLHVHYKEAATVTGVVAQEKVPLYAGPDENFHIITIIPFVEFVAISDQREGWYKVRHGDSVGWIRADVIQVV